MTKLEMREYFVELEDALERSLKKWKKESKIENGKVTQIEWQFELSHIIIDVFWHDGEEKVVVYCLNPHVLLRNRTFRGLSKATTRNVLDAVGNFAQIVMTNHRE